MAAVAGAALLVYGWTASRTLTFGDSGELIAASWRGGLAHPPGYPLYTTIAGAVLHVLPWGEPALRTNLLSALAAAAACGVIAVTARGMTGSALGGIAAGGIVATSSVVWSTATETEVYALHALLLALLLEASRRGRLLLAAAALGWGLAHHPTIVLALPSALLLAAPAIREARPRRIALAAAVAIAIPLALDATLLLRAARDPGAWGGVSSLPSLLAHLGASRYLSYDLGWAALVRPEGWSVVARTLVSGLAVTGAVAAFAGARGLKTRDRWAMVLLAAAGVAFALRYATEDVDVFLIPTIVAVGVLAAGAVAVLEVRASRVIAAVVAGLIVAIPLAANARRADRHGDSAAAYYAADMLATLPENATLFTDGDDAFVLAYATQVRGDRPDVNLIDRRGLLFASARFYGADTGDERRMIREIAEIERGSRAVYFMGWPGYELPAGWRFEPEGIFFRATRADSGAQDDATLWAGYHEAEVVESARIRPGAFAAAVAGTYPLMRAEEALARGRVDVAVRELDEAMRRAPDSETILNTVGTTWARRGELARAIAAFERAVSAKPQSLRGWLNLAQARALSGDRAGAEAAASRARALVR